jgi:hypothetical protein
MAKLFGLHLDESGSNTLALSKFFSDPTGTELRQVVAEAFFLAQREATNNRTKQEVWDRVAQTELFRLATQNTLMSPGAELLLEKGHGGKIVWNYGIRVFAEQTGRKWTLPDGLIRTADEIIAVELDHGRSLGNWARQLLKATRLAASPRIDGVLFCYCTPTDQRKWFTTGDFTDEFKAIIETGIDKPVGIITIGEEELAIARREMNI